MNFIPHPYSDAYALFCDALNAEIVGDTALCNSKISEMGRRTGIDFLLSEAFDVSWKLWAEAFRRNEATWHREIEYRSGLVRLDIKRRCAEVK